MTNWCETWARTEGGSILPLCVPQEHAGPPHKHNEDLLSLPNIAHTFRPSSLKVQDILKSSSGNFRTPASQVQTYKQFISLGGKCAYSWQKIKFIKVLLHSWI